MEDVAWVRRGEITEIVGRPSSGRTSLFTACLRDVTRRGAIAALVDTDQTFDPASATRAGVDLRCLLWVRCGGRRDLALRAAPLAVVAPAPSVTRVVDANAAAREYGVHAGVTETEARARCPTLVSRPFVREHVAAARHALLEAALGVSPRVEDGGAGLVYVDAAGLRWLHGDPAAVGRRLVGQARAVGFPGCRVALGEPHGRPCRGGARSGARDGRPAGRGARRARGRPARRA